jgi:PIN domain nuclease of toxin-antitoxin system
MERAVIVLDTHVLFWLAVDKQKLTAAARRALKADRLVSAISLRELAAMHAGGRFTVAGELADWLGDLLLETDVEVVPIDVGIAARSVRIAWDFHGDPADQIIAATAIELDAPLVTADENLRRSPALQTIW